MSRIQQFVRDHRFIVGLIFFCLLGLLLTWPIGPFNTSHLPDGATGDQGAAIWGLAWVPYALRHGIDLFHTNFLDYPLGANLAFTPPAPLLGLLAAPITLLLGPVAAFNSLTFFSFVASAGSMYAVLHLWTKRWMAPFLGGLFFGFSPYMISQGQPGGHVLFLFMALLPWIAWCLYDLFVDQQRRPVRMGLLLGGLLAAQAYVAWEIVGDVAIVVSCVFVVALIVHPSDVAEKVRHMRTAIIPTFVVFIVPVSWQLWWTVAGPGRIAGPTQPVGELQALRVNLLSPLVPLGNQLVAPTHLAQIGESWVGGNLSENGAYLGLPLVGLLIVLAVIERKNILIRLSLALAFVAFVFSLGNRLQVGSKLTSIPLPEAVFAHLSLLDNTVPARFSIIVVLFVAIALGVGIDAISQQRPSSDRPFRYFAAAAAVGVVVLVPLLPRAPLSSKPLPWSANLTSSIDAIPPGTVTLTYPYSVPRWPEPMAWEAVTGMHIRIVGGYLNVQLPNGTSSDNSPLVLEPSYVEDFFTEAQFGGPWFASVGAPTAANRVDLCTFIRNWSIGAIVAWDAGANPQEVAVYIESVVGQPTINTGTVLTWIDPVAHCPS